MFDGLAGSGLKCDTAHLVRCRSMRPRYSHITPSDRMSIRALVAARFSCRAIARNIHHSPVCREVSRATVCATASAADYCAGRAQVRSVARRAVAGAARRKLGADVKTPLWRAVPDGLRCHWSPEQIAGKLPSMNKPATLSNPALAEKLSVSRESSTALSTRCRAARCAANWSACRGRATRRGCRVPVGALVLSACATDLDLPAAPWGCSVPFCVEHANVVRRPRRGRMGEPAGSVGVRVAGKQWR